MLEMLVYPVSAVMKFWHWVLEGLSVPANAAWIASIVLFVFTVRGLILPFAWQTYKTTRTTFLMRPYLQDVEKQYGTSTDPKDLRAEEEARQQIHKDHGYNPLAACVPAMIQVPMFLGLYRVLLWMAVPDASEGRRIGMLSDAEIESFRTTTFFDVPLPAYVAMDPEQFDFLGTTLHDVRSLAIPLITTAIVLTSTNMVISQFRSRSTLEWNSAFARRIYSGMWWVIPLVAVMLALAGLTGLVPIALLMYWVLNNLFTTVQNAVLWWLSVRQMPSTERHHQFQEEVKAEALAQTRERKEQHRALRRKRISSITHPTTFADVRREIRDEKRSVKEQKASDKAAKKALNKERNEARKVMNKEKAAELAAEREAKKKAKEAEKNGEAPSAEPEQA